MLTTDSTRDTVTPRSTTCSSKSSRIVPGFSATHSGYTLVPDHDKVVALIDQMAQETDVAKRKDLMTQIQTFGTTTMPMVTLVDRIALDGTRLPDGVLSVANQTPGYIIFQTVAEQGAGKAAGS